MSTPTNHITGYDFEGASERNVPLASAQEVLNAVAAANGIRGWIVFPAG